MLSSSRGMAPRQNQDEERAMGVELDRVRGCLFGTAFGDALGAPTEFMRSTAQIRAAFLPDGPREPRGTPWRVTDDTQMMLAVGDALLEAIDTPDLRTAAPGALSRAFVRWYHDPDNNRAPGNTCLRACEGIIRGQGWMEATVMGSKGCGANMRVQPVGLLDPARFTDAEVAGLAQLQAAITHGHPTGLAAADLTARAIRLLITGTAPADLSGQLRAWAMSQREVYHADWLGALWRRSQDPSPQAFMRRGWEECLGILDRLDAALLNPPADDPCDATGEGWIAEEALGSGLLCFLLYAHSPQDAIWRGAVTRGDSDSIACLAGAFAGAWHGMGGWPEGWAARVEYKEDLEAQSAAIAAL
jgi:ADP-ribosylglycohydrolase